MEDTGIVQLLERSKSLNFKLGLNLLTYS